MASDVPAAVVLGVPLVLASASPRRRELLERCGFVPAVVPADLDESILDGEDPQRYVTRLALDKANAVAAHSGAGRLVLAADTTVDVDGVSLGKPVDADEAAAMLRRLSGRGHLVHTGVAVVYGAQSWQVTVSTTVRFAVLDPATVSWYVATGEWRDKAGGYAIQGAGAALVAGVDGSVSNVVGLPLAETLATLRAVGEELSSPRTDG